MRRESIFVSIAAFCDPYLQFTIESAFHQAQNPESLVLGVVDQNTESLWPWLARQPFSDQVRYLHIHPVHSRGVCWARHLAQTLFDGESYFLQIDSHTWFALRWDEILRTHIEVLRKLGEKPILSIYPPGFEFDEAGKPFKKISLSERVAYFRVKPEQSLTAEDPSLTFKVDYKALPTQENGAPVIRAYYALGFHVAGGFLFSLGNMVKEIPYDPGFYFHGEEQGVALRAFTHGWEIFHPQFHLVPLFHLYKLPKSSSNSLHWRTDLEAQRSVKWPERRRQARQRLADLVTGRLSSPYGLGTARTIQAFVERSGIDYPHFALEPCKVDLTSVELDDRQTEVFEGIEK
ncbi:MAG: GlcNAc-transferase family protein [Wenzhouxiangella sp.]